jgi:DNA-binding transcriptional MerR regulator
MSKPGGAERERASSLPSIPAKRYFTIGEVSDLCAVTQLKPIKRRGNRRYYQHHEVLLIRRIRELLYEQGFTINGARNRLDGAVNGSAARRRPVPASAKAQPDDVAEPMQADKEPSNEAIAALRDELRAIRALLASGRAAQG